MGFHKRIFYLGLSIFFLWLTINIPNIPQLFLMDLSQLSENQLILLQYSALTGYVGSMITMAVTE